MFQMGEIHFALAGRNSFVLRNKIESVLPRYLEALNHYSATYKFNLRGGPAWFKHWFRFLDTMPAECWGSLPTEIPQNLYKSKKWMGFAIYASTAEKVRRHLLEENEEVNYRVYLQLGIGKSFKRVSRELEHFKSSSEEHHQLLIFYIPRAEIPEELFTQTSSATEMVISFRIDSPYVKFQIGGMRVVYQEDMQEFAQTIIKCMEREDSLEFYDKLVVKDLIALMRSQGYHLERISDPKERDSGTRQEKKTGLTLNLFVATFGELKFPSGNGSYISRKATLQKSNCLLICSMMLIGWGLLYVLLICCPPKIQA
ncbi:uncharacterized protein LOC133742335 [Rosa rugosa]|uniref:uncharacterized protein LOC133742335 n=1 Tax=Rosa rugosa TaxID=74645 RepID=UPI002B407478|nr:uncharacterized protein LOC133742335 [Rosa rugosa]